MSPPWKYVASCKTTEEFLLGQCTGAVELADREGNNSGNNGDGQGEYCIDWQADGSYNMAELMANARRYLAGVGFTQRQPRGSETQEQRYQELVALNQTNPYQDSTGKVISPDLANSYEVYYGGGRALLFTNACGGTMCYDYIMNYCAQAGFNPVLCVAMNLSESGGSNHIRFTGSYDFGCLAAEPNNINSGLDCITNRFFNNHRGKDYNAMFDIYAEHGQNSTSYAKIRQYYSQMSGGIGIKDGACQ